MTVNAGDQRIDERLAATDALTNKLNSSGGAFGGGLVAGYNFVMTGNIAAGPYVSWDIYNQKINHDFPGGSFIIGSTTHWIAEVGLKAAYAVSGSTAVYGLAGASFLNEDLRINFGGPVTNESRTHVGITVGGGVNSALFFCRHRTGRSRCLRKSNTPGTKMPILKCRGPRQPSTTTTVASTTP